MALLANIQRIINHFGRSSKFERVMNGMKVLSVNPGQVEMEMEVKEEHLNNGGTLHGGMICTIVDSVSTYAIATTKDNKFGVSTDLNVSFVSAAFPGEKVIIKSQVLRTGKNLAYADVNIYKPDGKLVASGRHTKYLNLGNDVANSD